MQRSVVLMVLVLGGVGQAQPDGGLAVTKSAASVSLADAPTDTYAVDVYRPAGTPPFPVVALGHGFQNGKENHEALARELAGLGLLVVVPQFPLGGIVPQYGWADHARNGNILLAAVDQQVAAGVADGQRLGLGGHSAGGLAAWVAASSRSATKVVVLLDAVDQAGLGAGRETTMSAPVLWTFSFPATCNSFGNSAGWYPGKPGPKARFRVAGSMHCDPQEPVSAVCSLSCGGYLAAKSRVYNRYAVDAFARALLGRTTPCLASLVGADVDAGVLVEADVQWGSCAGAPDAGVDAGVVDAGSPPDDAGAVQDAGQPGSPDAGLDPGDAGPPEDAGPVSPAADAGPGPQVTAPGGCGCGAGRDGAWTGLLALLAWGGYRRARHAVVRPG